MQPKLTLSIADQDQPARLHRFRYFKEVKDGRMGSVLHSRASGKSYVKVVVTADSPITAGCKLKLIGCTVFEDLMPHPFFLAGDDCKEGVFQKELTLDESSLRFEVCLEKIGIVCTQKKSKGKVKGQSQSFSDQEFGFFDGRIVKYNFFGKTARSDPFKGKDINRLRLAFQVIFQSPDSSDWTAANCKPLCTEVIGDAKIFSTITVDYIIPQSVSRPDQDIWLYLKDPLPSATTVTDLLVVLECGSSELKLEVQPKELKKHLIVFDFTNQRMKRVSGEFSVTVLDKKSGELSEPVKLELCDVSAGEEMEPRSKRARLDASSSRSQPGVFGSADPLNELLDAFSEEPVLSNEDYDEVMSHLTSDGAGDTMSELYDEDSSMEEGAKGKGAVRAT